MERLVPKPLRSESRNAGRKNSGGLFVHKASQHFDLVNGWLGARPLAVMATAKREFYTPEMARRMGLSGPHVRCRTCPEKHLCGFYLDLAASPGLKTLYLEQEQHDGYLRDRCVFRRPGVGRATNRISLRQISLSPPKTKMKSLRRSLAALAAVCLITATAVAAHDPAGTWTWTQAGRGGGGGGGTPRESTLTLTNKDGKIAGKLSMPGRDGAATSTDISNASIKDDVVTFSVEREFNGTKFVTKYSGKLAGDTITGEAEGPGRDGATQKREWVAQRKK